MLKPSYFGKENRAKQKEQGMPVKQIIYDAHVKNIAEKNKTQISALADDKEKLQDKECAAYLLLVGAELRKLRKEKEYSMLQASSFVGISDKYIQKVETGATNVSLKLLYKLLFFYEVSFAVFFLSIQIKKDKI